MEATIPYNGSGTFSRLYSWVVDAANSVNISSSRTDAEMNGFAAGLTNCVTRDGQSPPSADMPWGAKRITNLGAATAGTDALNRDTADARYIQTSLAAVTLAGSLTATTSLNGATLAISGASALHAVTATTVAATGDSSFRDITATRGDGTGAVYLGIAGGSHQLFFDGTAYFLPNAALNTITVTAGDNSTKAASTAFVVTALANSLASYALLASPPLTGTPTAPTAAAGTATTQLATTAFVDALRDVPSNAKAASYQLALTDRGGAVDFNGTSLTCTIPANSGTAFPVGTTIALTNTNSTSLSIAITSDTLTLAGTTTTGTRTLAQNGIATLRKITSTSWLISGAGLS